VLLKHKIIWKFIKIKKKKKKKKKKKDFLKIVTSSLLVAILSSDSNGSWVLKELWTFLICSFSPIAIPFMVGSKSLVFSLKASNSGPSLISSLFNKIPRIAWVAQAFCTSFYLLLLCISNLI